MGENNGMCENENLFYFAKGFALDSDKVFKAGNILLR